MCLHHLVPVPSFSLCLSRASPSLFNSLSCLLSLHSSFISSFTFHVVAFSPFTKTATDCHYLSYLSPNELCSKRELKGGHLGIISNVYNVLKICASLLSICWKNADCSCKYVLMGCVYLNNFSTFPFQGKMEDGQLNLMEPRYYQLMIISGFHL